mmetsp:Transcript_22322/g.64092  ORF Transcript_22322/g.64092 Transcript_22322/m.64092 type:complete len:232 (-) Transcript_22322:129-824(-)
MALRGALLVAGAAVTVAASGSPCPAGSVPIHECKFMNGGAKDCDPGVNLGAAARKNDQCEVPAYENGCMLKGDAQTLAWTWKSDKINNCCNCYPVKSPCPFGSVPFIDCDFHNGGSEPCLKGVNVGAAAKPDNGLCQVPSQENGCMLQGDQATMAWMWKSRQSNVECCNCFMVGTGGPSLAQTSARAGQRARLRRHSPDGDADASSMLQVPTEDFEEMEPEEADEEQRKEL